MQLNISHARKVLEIVDAGLVCGIGVPEPGKLCVEAAVCLALGQPHGDEPTCVAAPDRAFKITLNDATWSSPAARAAGLRRVAVMQLGTAGMDRTAWIAKLAELTIRRVLPVALRAAGLEAEASRCEEEGTAAAARAAYAAYAAADAADAAYAAAADAAYAAAAYADAAYAAVRAADAAAYAAAYAADAAEAAAADAAEAAAARAADAAAADADAARAARDHILLLSARCAEEAYELTGSPGTDLLRRIEAGE